MAITIEREILNFNPVKPDEDEGARPFVALGVVYPGIRLVWDVYPYLKRNVYLKGEPFAGGCLTEQPTLALVNGKGFRTLAYLTDIYDLENDYGEGIVNQILARVREQTHPPVDPWEGHDDY